MSHENEHHNHPHEHQHHGVEIIINGRPKTVHMHDLGYREIVGLAFPGAPFTETTVYTVLYSCQHPKLEGTMVDGASIQVHKGMIINVSKTDKS